MQVEQEQEDGGKNGKLIDSTLAMKVGRGNNGDARERAWTMGIQARAVWIMRGGSDNERW
jgi:hypothetical protein